MNNPNGNTGIHIVGIIPARMASSRFPGKPLVEISGTPMVGHVYFRSKMCERLNEVYVATCDEEIANYTRSIGGEVVMTSPAHERASDRTAEAMLKIEQRIGNKIEIAAMIQGDEPMLYPEMIEEAIKPMLKDKYINVTNLMAEIKTIEEFDDPNEVKVVVNNFNDALYFSREPIPSRKKNKSQFPMFKQVCIIPFRRNFLLEYHRMKPTPLEIIESVDMMRILENGLKVKMVFTKYEMKSVDTRKDLEIVNKMMANDILFKNYQKRI